MSKKVGRPRIKGTTDELYKKQALLNKSYTYLNNNFYKFSQDNKIKIALALCTKDLAQKVEVSGKIEYTVEQRQERINALNRIYSGQN